MTVWCLDLISSFLLIIIIFGIVVAAAFELIFSDFAQQNSTHQIQYLFAFYFYFQCKCADRQTHRHTDRHTDRHRQKKGQQTVLLKIHFQSFWTLLVDCSHVISQMVRFGSFSCGPHIGHVMINFLFILESTVYDCLNHKMTVFGPKKAKCGRNITIPKWPKW